MSHDVWPINRDVIGGSLMLTIGAAAAFKGRDYGVGSLTRMGPGFLPVTLGVVLAALGVLLILTSLRGRSPGPSLGIAEDMTETTDWRGVGCIVGGVAGFIVLGHFFGLIPASLCSVFVAALGDRAATPYSAAVLAACVTVAGTLLFSYGLGIRFPLLHFG